MSDLEDAIAAVSRDESQTKNNIHATKRPYGLWIGRGLLALVAVLAVMQLHTLIGWITGVPDEAIQSDIVTLLKATDQRLQQYDETDYPDKLPADSPHWLIGYKKTLAGYQMNAAVDGVAAELTRSGAEVSIRQYRNDEQ